MFRIIKSFIGLWLLRLGWKFAVWMINKKYKKGTKVSRFVNGINSITTQNK